MKESIRRRTERYAAAATVLALHLVLIAALIMMPRTGKLAAATANTVEVLFVAPAKPPQLRVTANLPRRGHRLALTVEPPVHGVAVLSRFPNAGVIGKRRGHRCGLGGGSPACPAGIRNPQPPAFCESIGLRATGG